MIFQEQMFALETEAVHMMTEEKRKYLHDVIEKLNEKQLEKLYQLIRGIFGKTL